MTVTRKLSAAFALAGICALMLGGCIVAPEPAYVGAPVAVAPPPPQAEVIGAPPVVGYVWVGGYWNWVGERHVWVGGHWVAPRSGYHWIPHRWVQTRGGWRLAEGHWERGRR